MAVINAGDLKELSCDHPELGSRVFEPKAGEDYNMRIGGQQNSDDDGDITSNGKPIRKKSRVPWSLEPTIGDNSGDIDYLQDLIDNPADATWTARFANTDVRSGDGTVVGELMENPNAGTIQFKISGGGKFELI